MKKTGKLFVISASSGAGKTTLVREVLARLSVEHGLKQVITYTTKQPRPGEMHGIDYHFLSESDFIQKIEQGFFAEHSTVYGAYYGFPMGILHEVDRGAHYIAIVDRAGAASLRAHRHDAVLIWIKPPDKNALEARLTSRAQDSDEVIAFRLAIAQQELEGASIINSLFNHIIINDDRESAAQELEMLVRSEIGEAE